MKKLLILLFFITSCKSNNVSEVNSFSSSNLFKLNIDDYKEMLINYNKNKDFPNIEE